MADIAILVAEEYERRAKSSRKRGEEEIELFSCVAELGQKMKERVLVVMEKKMVKPRSEMTAAASVSLFSA